jgi:hypothetical protein
VEHPVKLIQEQAEKEQGTSGATDPGTSGTTDPGTSGTSGV